MRAVLSVINSRGVAFGKKSFIWVGTLQTRMFKEYYCVLLIMDKLFKSRHITTLNEYYWVINHNGLNCWTTKLDTFYYLEGSEVYRASTPEM